MGCPYRQRSNKKRCLQSIGGDVMLDAKTISQKIAKYTIQACVVALTAYYLPSKRIHLQEVLVIALVASTTFSLLDLFAPSVTIR